MMIVSANPMSNVLIVIQNTKFRRKSIRIVNVTRSTVSHVLSSLPISSICMKMQPKQYFLSIIVGLIVRDLGRPSGEAV